ncbi:hypothetical protein [Xanthomonas hortorum]|uniref:hypothetical protein n=1 Tax=Xanthomonas hortorum TaxID=56454 RepID=UPI0029364E2A|nr:hypothetical protein [Xanthomonas hortorum]MDV2452176.1 hypothetical protein [Xanthomonas hortorum NBC5720]
MAVSVISRDCGDDALLLAMQATTMIATTPLSKVAQSHCARTTEALHSGTVGDAGQHHRETMQAHALQQCVVSMAMQADVETAQSLQSIAPLSGMPRQFWYSSSAPLQRGRLHRGR